VCIEFATSSRRLPTKIWKLNLLRIYPIELSRVELCWQCVHARWLSCSLCDWCRKLETGSRLTTGAFTPPTRRNSNSLSANCSDSSRLSPTSCEFNTHRRCNSTRQLSCVGGVYWALAVVINVDYMVLHTCNGREQGLGTILRDMLYNGVLYSLKLIVLQLLVLWCSDIALSTSSLCCVPV